MRDEAFGALARHHLASEPDKAFAFVNEISDVYQRYDVMRSLIWKMPDPKQAAAYVENAGLLDADRDALLRRLSP